ncbi:MAG: GatB/YqeY domain-containing protein [Gammaproteobacteria bacterium]|nr:GatB/YqeY domain-containing protein [Gammaproteobacteria bacterium]
MTGSFKERLTEDVKVALKGGEKAKLAALRLISAAVKQYEVDHRVSLEDGVALELLTKMAKQRRESISQFQSAGRDDLVAQEQFELDIILAYLPQPLTEAEVEAAVVAAIAETGAAGVRDMGKVMGVLNPRIKGRADMAAVSALVKARLAG